MAVSLKDVARLAGVSIKTVSNVVNNSPSVSAVTRAKVRAALDALDYRPNTSARGLRTGRTDLITLAIPALDEPYFAELTGLIVEAAARQGWTVLIEPTGGERNRERLAAGGSRLHRIDGCIVSPLALTGADLAELAGQRPMVLLGERLPRLTVDHVAVDSVQATYEATRHLIELGRRRIAFLGAQPATRAGGVRLAGYRSALAEAGQPPEEDLIMRTSRFGRSDGAAAMATLLAARQPPDAVVCASDLLALGALRTLSSVGVRVPEDVAVTGFDDVEDARFSNPSLTSVAPDKAGMAEAAVELLCRRLRERSARPPVDVVVGHDLRVRESSAGAAVTSGPPR